MKEKKDSENPVVEIAAVVGAFTVAIAALVLIFASEFAWVVIFTTLAMAMFGIALSKESLHHMHHKKEKEPVITKNVKK